jgi:hypothetical protein
MLLSRLLFEMPEKRPRPRDFFFAKTKDDGILLW